MTSDQTLQSIDDAARQWQSERPERVPALAVSIRDDNGIVLNRSYGIHDSVSRKPLEENPLFPIASQSKTFTALAILQLVNERRKHPLTGRPLSLDDQITELLPSLKIDWMEGVTLRDALCHRTLLRGGEASSLSFDELRNLPIKDIKPAEQSGYSNRMYNRLGLIIEDILGDKENGFAERGISTFSDYISKEIVDRHKLGDIYPGYSSIPQQMRARIPSGFTEGSNEVLSDWQATVPSGGFFATPEAITGFFHKLAKGEILPEHKIDANGGTGMFEKLVTGSGWAGLGTQINSMQQSLDNQKEPKPNAYYVAEGMGDLAGHTGGLNGYQSETRYNPQTGLTVAVMRTGFWVPNWGEEKDREFWQLMGEDSRTAGTPLVMSSVFQRINAGDNMPAPGQSSRYLDAIRVAEIDGQRKEHGIPGLTIFVRNNEGVLVNGVWGLQNKNSGEPLSESALFPLSSQSKNITATAILQLIDGQGIHPRTQRPLSLNDQITELLPQLDHPNLRGVTLGDALSHNTTFYGDHIVDRRSRNVKWLDGREEFPQITGDQNYEFPIDSFARDNKPGYSNAMFAHLGRVVEDMSGLSYSDYIKQEIVARHGLGEIYPSLADVPQDQRGRIPKGYHWGVEAPDVDVKGLVSAGGGFATTEAWTAYFHKLAAGQILSAQSTAQMFEVPQNHENGSNRGLGVFRHSLATGEELWGPDGSGPGYRSQMLHDFKSHTTYFAGQTRNDLYPRFDTDHIRNSLGFAENPEPRIEPLEFIKQIRNWETESNHVANLIVDLQWGTIAQSVRPDGSVNGMAPEVQKQYLDKIALHLDSARKRGEPIIWVAINRDPKLHPVELGSSSRERADLVEMGFLPRDMPQTEGEISALKYYEDWLQTHGPRKNETVYEKISFSAFADGTELIDHIKSQGISDIAIMGGNAEVCVLATAKGAADLGIRATIMSDLLISDNNHDLKKPTIQIEDELKGLADRLILRPQEYTGILANEPFAHGYMPFSGDNTVTREKIGFRNSGVYFPDAVVDPFVGAAQNVLRGTPDQHPMLLDKEPRFTLEESKGLVLAALNNFDQGLGAKAQEIFDAGFGKAPNAGNDEVPSITTLWGDKDRYINDGHIRELDGRNLDALEDGARWRVAQVSPDKTFMMRSLAASSPASTYGPANNHPYAVIDYHFDGTLNSVIYLAHEVGHAIADDYSREAGFVNHGTPVHMNETQAYFVQHVMYDYLSRHPDQSVAFAAQQHFTDTMRENANLLLGSDVGRMHGRPLGILASAGVFSLAQDQDLHARTQTIEAMLGRQGPKNISEVMTMAGITNQNDMERLAHSTTTNITRASGNVEQPQQQQRQHLPTEADRARQAQWQTEQQQRQAARRVRKDYSVLSEAAETASLSRVMSAVAKSAHGAAAGLGVVGAVSRLNGQLQEDTKGDTVQATAGVAAMTSDTANAAGGIVSATTQVVERFAPGISEGALGAASRIAGRVALPLAVASAGADVVAGIRSNDAERVAGASGGLAGGIFGGVAAGAAAGALLGVETGPGAIVTGIVGGVVGGIMGEKVAKEYLSDGVRWLMGSKEEKDNPSAPSNEANTGDPSRPNRTVAKGISAAPT